MTGIEMNRVLEQAKREYAEELREGAKNFIVYALYASDESDPFYVGQTNQGMAARLRGHIYFSRSKRKAGQQALRNRIREIEARGAHVLPEILRSGLSSFQAFVFEAHTIRVWGKLWPLVNCQFNQETNR